jgi:lipopolysaccharide assembly outer membrane protein LptD (OstA)
MNSRWFILGVLLLATCMNRLEAQPSKVIVLEQADSLVGRVVDGLDAREFSGHVRIRQENVIIQCDHALQFVESGKILLTGHVVVHDDSLTMTAPRGVYYRDTRRAEAYEHVTLDDRVSHLEAEFGTYDVDPRVAFFRSHVIARDTSSVLHADSLTYERNRKLMHATGRVRVLNQHDAVTITGGDLIHDGSMRYSRVTLSPVLVKYDTASGGGD